MTDKIDDVVERLAPVGETLARVRALLEPSRALIGFAGAPWTVLTYMIEGRSSDRSRARSLAYSDPECVDRLLHVLIDATSRYLIMPAKAGAPALQLFESWAEGLSEVLFAKLVIEPHRQIVDRVRAAGVQAPIIGFPRGAGALLEDYAGMVGVEGVGLDIQIPLGLGRRLQQGRAIQGALDPLLLRAGGKALDEGVESMLGAWTDGPYIFNLGHGILPDTPIEHVERVVSRVTGQL